MTVKTNNARYCQVWYEPDNDQADPDERDEFDIVVNDRPGYKIAFMFLVYRGKKEAYRIILEKIPDARETR